MRFDIRNTYIGRNEFRGRFYWSLSIYYCNMEGYWLAFVSIYMSDMAVVGSAYLTAALIE